MTTLVLTVLGDDRPGLVQAVSEPVEAVGGSWQRSQLTRLAGKFAGVVLVSVPEARVAELESALPELETHGLEVRVERVASAPSDEAGRGERLGLHLLGDDRPGIVAEISGVLAERGIGIEDMLTDVREAPMAGGMLFEVDALLTLPAGEDLEAVRAVLEEVAGELMVDLTLTAPGA